MDKKIEISKIQKTLLTLLPQWNYHIVKPFKKSLSEGISLEMYNCIQGLQWLGGIATMTELCQISQTPKHQMTKMVNRLVEYKLVERIDDPSDRRVIKIQLTNAAQCYIDHFLSEDAKCFKDLLEQMGEEDRVTFHQSVQNISHILCRLSNHATSEEK